MYCEKLAPFHWFGVAFGRGAPAGVTPSSGAKDRPSVQISVRLVSVRSSGHRGSVTPRASSTRLG